MEHRSLYLTLEAIAAAKECLPLSVRRGGVVWLNGDDPWVARMRVPEGVRKRFFGRSPDFDLWAGDVLALGAEPLEFRAHVGGEQATVVTQLVGEQWIPSVLAALGIALECGVSLAQAAASIAQVPPYPGRMHRVALSNGAVMIRDDFKAGIDSFAPALKALGQGPPGKRWAVVSGANEVSWGPKDRMMRLAREIVSVADAVVFVGDHADAGCRRAVAEGMPSNRVFQAGSAREAAAILRRESGPGDLILVKGTPFLHLARVYYEMEAERLGRVACGLRLCKRRILCDHCSLLYAKSAPTNLSIQGAGAQEGGATMFERV
jgi:UDP-N-acetylmuramoyl-tripeptide--D-alanyl-D-alanine ligase